MPITTQTGKTLIVLGIVIATLGVIVYFFGDKLRWIGRLPGDIRVEREHFKFYFPLTTMILISLIISLLWRLFRK